MLQLVHTCDIARTQAVGTNGRKNFVTLTSLVPCLALPMSAEAAIQNKFDVSRAWQIFFDDGTNVRVGDRITYNSAAYMVRGIKPYAGLPFVSHIETLCEQENV